METLPHRLRCENMNAYLWTAWIGVIHNSCGKKNLPFDSCGKNLAFKFALLQTLTHYCLSTQGSGSKMETLPHRLRCENMNAYLWTAWIGVSHNSCRKEKLPSTHVEKILPSNLHSCKHSHNIVSPPRATDQKWRPFHTDSSAKTWMLTFEPHDLALSTTHVGKIFPSTHVEKILPSNLHSCKHSHIIVCPPKAPDQKWRPFHTDSGAKTWMLTFEPHELALLAKCFV